MVTDLLEIPGDSSGCQIDASMDIGGTLIGMHLRRVAVPVRTNLDHIGEAIDLCARTQPRYIGSPWSVYQG